MYYTKYRPQKFSEISQPNDIANALMHQLKDGKTAHAYLFVGPRGTGKTTTARILAKALNCEKLDKTGDPCSTCFICKAVTQGNFVDLIEIDAASNRGIDDIRELRDKIKLSPSTGSIKVYIIDEVHMLTTEAFNALLKTLEEPPAHAVFILCTTESHKVPDTIKSRCQVFKFKRATIDQLTTKLTDICKKEKVKGIKPEDLRKIAEASFGGFRDAETLLQQVVEGGMDADSFVGLSAVQNYLNFVDNLLARDSQAALKFVGQLVDDGMDINVWLSGLLNHLRDLLFVKTKVDVMVDFPADVMTKMQNQADSLTYGQLVEYINEFIESSNKVTDSMLPQLPLEISIIRLCEDMNEPTINVQRMETPLAPKPQEAPKKKQPTEDQEDYGDDFFEETVEVEESPQDIVEFVSDIPLVAIAVIEEKWKALVKSTVQINASIHTLLKSAQPIEVVGNKLYIEVSYKFHKERIESPKNRQIIENTLRDILGEDIKIECKVNESNRPAPKEAKATGELTDYNVSAPIFSAGNGDSPNISDIFDGALPY